MQAIPKTSQEMESQSWQPSCYVSNSGDAHAIDQCDSVFHDAILITTAVINRIMK